MAENIRLTVTAYPKKEGEKEKVYTDVYDIGHYCGNDGHGFVHTIRLMSYRGKDKLPKRDHISLEEYNVSIEWDKEA